LKTSKILITNGELFIDNKFINGNIVIKNGKIKNIILNKKLDIDKFEGYRIIDAKDCYVSYGFLDPHVHFRTPGQEYKEDWESGIRAAIKGGYTFVIDMPNNTPPATNEAVLLQKNELAKNSKVNYGFYIGLTDENSKDIKKIYNNLKKRVPIYGIKVFLGSSTGSLLVKNSESIKDGLKSGLINLYHCEDEEVLLDFAKIPYNDIKDHSTKRPPIAEVSSFKKIIDSAKDLKDKAKIYICHISSEELLKATEESKNLGFKIVAEVTPHHLFFSLEELLDLEWIDKKNKNNFNIFKVNPPIREKSSVGSLRKGFNEGVFDIMGTDHAPHLLKEKLSDNPPSGLPGLEYSFYALYSLFEKNELSLTKIFYTLTNGYKIFNIKKRGVLKKGNYADITIINKKKFCINSKNNQTKADFCPYEELSTNTTIDTVIVGGKIVLLDNKFI